MWAMKHFRHYLYGHKCEVFTDHEALKSLMNTPHPSGKLARWGLTLQEFDIFSILTTLRPQVTAKNGEDPNEELIDAQQNDPELL